jgi:ribosome maturation factor RimP
MREAVLELVSRIAEEMHIYVEALFLNEGARPKIIILCDTETGIQSDELTELTLKLRDSEELETIVGDDFEMEVSSPGIEFPLRLPRHFKKNIGREIELTHHRDDLPNPLFVKLTEVSDSAFSGLAKIKKRDEAVQVNFADIENGKIKLKW